MIEVKVLNSNEELKPVVTMFPDGTSQVALENFHTLENSSFVRVFWGFENEAEFLHIAQIKRLLDTKNAMVSLYVPFLPYARQDKNVVNRQTFALTPFASLLNSLKFDAVIAVDPHSGVASRLINNFEDHRYGLIDNMVQIALLNNVDVLCFPDRGALARYSSIVKRIPDVEKLVVGNKKRNQYTGEIEGLDLVLASPYLASNGDILRSVVNVLVV